MGTFRDLTVYRMGLSLAMEIFELSKIFPKEERYSFTDQIKRSSRSVCANVGEGYRKRQYEAHFVSKASDADMENTETRVWLDFAHACSYIDTPTKDKLDSKSEEIGRLLNHMIQNPKQYTRKPK